MEDGWGGGPGEVGVNQESSSTVSWVTINLFL